MQSPSIVGVDLGSTGRARSMFEPGMRARLHQLAYPHVLERPALGPSEVEHISVLGAAALYLDAGQGKARDPVSPRQGDER